MSILASAPHTSQQALPLAGMRVVDYSHFLAGPYLSRCLAALGAEVIKVERPDEGDPGRAYPYQIEGSEGPESGYFMQQNMGKKGLCVNMKDPRGKALMDKLCDSADVFVENYRPGALSKLGLGYTTLAARNPGLVYCSISAYGHSGPESHRAGFGLIAEAKSGIMAMVGNPGETPPMLRVALGDMYTGIHGVAAVCAALLGRVKSGKGQHIDMALYDTLVSMHEYAVQCYTLSNGQEIPVQTGSDLPSSTLYGVFSAKDGDLAIAAQVDDSWARFARLIGGDNLAADQRFQTLSGRNAHRGEILQLARDWVSQQDSVAACLVQLDAAEVPSAKVQRIDEVVNDPQILARGMILEQDHPRLGKIKMPNLPFHFSGCDITPTRPAPMLGEHNRDIATDLGFDAASIEAMVKDGVLYARSNTAL
jgi:crotonobetainyl-CoA:carnitine CoA-transferase CaiB-like acyl-CoA transferase